MPVGVSAPQDNGTMANILKSLPSVRVLLAALSLTLLVGPSAQANLTSGTPIEVFSGSNFIWEPDMAYDPVNQRFLAAYRANDKIWGLYLFANGQPTGAPFLLVHGEAYTPRLTARTGGDGGFLLTYWFNGQRQAVFVRTAAGQSIGPLLVDPSV